MLASPGIRPGRKSPRHLFGQTDRLSEGFCGRQPDGRLKELHTQVSERVLNWLTLGSLEAVAEIWQRRAVQRSFHLDSSEPARDARDVDRVDLLRAREPYPVNYRLRAQARLTNQLPANSAGDFPKQLSRERRVRFGGALPNGRANAPNSSLLIHRVRDARFAFGLERARPRRRK